MATPTYVALGTITLTGTDSEIVFSSIPATYRDLIVVCNFGTSSNVESDIRFNSDSGSNYSQVVMAGGSSSPVSGSSSSQTQIRALYNISSTRVMGTIQILDASATDKHKSVLLRHGMGNDDNVVARAARWASTSAITTIRFAPTSGTYSVGSTFSLYGVN